MSQATASSGKIITGRMVLLALLGFFALVATVNAIFIVMALRSHPGVADDNAYVDGLAYNQTLAAAESQRALGWQVTLTAGDGPAGEIKLRALDKAGAPVAAAAVRLSLRHPGRKDADREMAMIADGGGLWHAPAGDLPRGNWDVQALISRADGEAYRAEWRIWLQPEARP
ncbi:MAG TPA: FixH family protein [Alphaproteobacteria bacterium]|nr:FixH family protein [Alphaproteobacteria bacterium]